MKILYATFLLFINIITCISESKNLRVAEVYRPRSIPTIEGVEFAEEEHIMNTNTIIIGDGNGMEEGLGERRISRPIDLLIHTRGIPLGEEQEEAENALDTILASMFRQQRLIERYSPNALNLASCILIYAILMIALRV